MMFSAQGKRSIAGPPRFKMELRAGLANGPTQAKTRLEWATRHRQSFAFDTPAGKSADNGVVEKVVANDIKVSSDTLVQLLCLSMSGLIGSSNEGEYEKEQIANDYRGSTSAEMC